MFSDLFFDKLRLKLLLHIIQYFPEGGILRKSIAYLYPSEEVSHRLGREIISQIHRNHQSHRFFLAAPGNLLMDRADQHRR